MHAPGNAIREMRLDGKTPMKVMKFRFPNHEYDVHIGIVRSTRHPLLEQLRKLSIVNGDKGASVSIISPRHADLGLSQMPAFFDGASSFFTSGAVFYPDAFCHLSDSTMRSKPQYLYFESGRDRVLLRRGSFDMGRFGQGDALLVDDFGSCSMAYKPLGGMSGMEITVNGVSGGRSVGSFITGWHTMLETPGIQSWLPLGDFNGVNVPRRLNARHRQFLRCSAPSASPIVRMSTEGGLRTVLMSSSFSAPRSMVVSIPEGDLWKFGYR